MAKKTDASGKAGHRYSLGELVALNDILTELIDGTRVIGKRADGSVERGPYQLGLFRMDLLSNRKIVQEGIQHIADTAASLWKEYAENGEPFSREAIGELMISAPKRYSEFILRDQELGRDGAVVNLTDLPIEKFNFDVNDVVGMERLAPIVPALRSKK